MSDQSKKDEGNEARYGRLCEYVFNEMGAAERVAFEQELAQDAELQREHAELVVTAQGVRHALPAAKLPDAMRATLGQAVGDGGQEPPAMYETPSRGWLQAAAGLLVFLGAAYGLNALLKKESLELADDPAGASAEERVERMAKLDVSKRLGGEPAEDVPNFRAFSTGGQDFEAALAEVQPVAPQARPSGGPASPTAGKEQMESKPNSGDLSLAREQSMSVVQTVRSKNSFGKLDELNVPVAEPQLSAQFEASPLKMVRSRQPAPADAEACTSKKGTFRGPGDTVLPAGSDAALFELPPGPPSASPGPARPGPSGASSPGRSMSRQGAPAPRISGIRRLQKFSSTGVGSPFGGIGEQSKTPAGEWTYWWEFPQKPYGELRQSDFAARGTYRQTPNALQTGSSDFFLGRGERDASADEGRRAIPSKEEVQEVSDWLITRCGWHDSEKPRDMFYRMWGEHPSRWTEDEPLSTFGADVDTASYTLARRTLQRGRLPIKQQVRSEEFLNYFRADQPAPPAGEVFGLHLESAPSLFHADPMMEMLRVTVRGQDVADFERQPVALTLVIDVSGSMNQIDRMPLLKDALALLLTQLSYADSLSIVAFSTKAEVLAGMTSAAQRGRLEDAIFRLQPKGGTNIEAGLVTGFGVAAEGLVEGAVNRVILLSDGVGNIGATEQERILEQVESYRQKGIYLNTIGVGMGTHNDNFLEQLADRGDGMCQYFDSAREAEKVLVNDLTRTLQPIARDVKIQLEFDPQQVASYRQIGYENRALSARDFRDDAVDAGELNAGHQVTALYEILRLPGARSDKPLATLRVRHKRPFIAGASEAQRLQNETALELTQAIATSDLLPNFHGASWGYRRAILVAQFAECLRRSVHARHDSLTQLLGEVEALTRERDDQELFEFRDLVRQAVPLLQVEAEAQDPELLPLTDALKRLNYEVARDEQLRANGNQLEEREENPSREERIAELERSIRVLMRRRSGRWEEERADARDSLDFLGYGGTDEDEE